MGLAAQTRGRLKQGRRRLAGAFAGGVAFAVAFAGLVTRKMGSAALVGVAAVGLLSCGTGAMPRSIGHPLAGSSAPQFQMFATSSREVGIPGSDRTKVTVIDFWASWCTACQLTMPALDDLWRDRKRDGVMVIGVNVEESAAVADSTAEQFGASFPIVADSRLASMYAVASIPITFVVDQAGTIRWVGRDPSDIRRAVEVVLGE